MKLKLWRLLGRISSTIGISSRIQGGSNVVLMFHHVGAENQGLSVEGFQKVLEFVEENFEIVDIPEVFEKSEERRAAITFDDGYQNMFENAYPLLKEKNLPFTVFLNSEFITEGGKAFPEQLKNQEKIVNLDQAKELAEDELANVQNHGRHHRDLTKISGEELSDEINGSKEELEKLLDIEIESFCYPYGHYDEEAVRAASENQGYCLTVDRGFVDPGSTERSKIPRIDGAQDFKLLKWELTSVAEKIFSKMDKTRY
jgi:peptidoglycan/xylan/chitin deacetylase (PgdA/CDA1 family)